jgi:hypothetical protein
MCEVVEPGANPEMPVRVRPSHKSFQWGSLSRRVIPLAASLAGVCAAAGAQPAAWDKNVAVEVIAPDHRPDGKTWDLDIPVMIGAAMPNLGDPAPDMMLCVVDLKGAENCIHDPAVNRFGVPLSICPNVYKCTFGNVRVPSSGYFGFLVIDLDLLPSRQDYMVAAVLRNGGPADPEQAWKIEKNLKSLIHKWNAVGAPDEFPEAAAYDCSPEKPCFGSSKGGVPSISIEVPEIRACGMPIRGTLEFGPGDEMNSVEFEYRATENECPGTMEYVWQFGDGATKTTQQPRSMHQYATGGTYSARIKPRCVRKTTTCEAAGAVTSVSVGH